MRVLKCNCGAEMVLKRRRFYDFQGKELTHCPGCRENVITHLTRISKLPGESGGYKVKQLANSI